MTAAELASFRALLRDQAAAPSRPDRSLFERMRSRLTVVEGGAPARSDAPARGALAARAAAGVAWSAADDVLADPPPSEPPLFGRRSHDAPDALEATRWSSAASRFEPPSTPDELDDRPPPPSVRRDGPAPGVIAGWSRARPPSAHQRLLGRLEAVLLAEREGLDARRAADAPRL